MAVMDATAGSDSDRTATRERWRRAAVLGGLWAASEIVLGSFLHNLRLPFAGHLLTVIAVALLSATRRRWPQPGLAWRAGLIAATMKSVSPSAVLLGPMLAISMEGLLFDLGARLGRRGWRACALGGALAMSWTFLHQVGSLLVAFGPDLLGVYARLVETAHGLVGLEGLPAWSPLAAALGLELAVGAAAAVAGWRAAGGPGRPLAAAGGEAPPRDRRFAPGRSPSLVVLGLLLAGLPVGLAALARLPLPPALAVVTAAVLLLAWRDRRVIRRLGRPGLWLAIFVVAAAVAAAAGNGASAAAVLADAGRLTARALFVTAWFGALAAELAHPALRRLARRLGSAHLSEAVELAFAGLPGMVASLPPAREILRRPVSSLASLVADLDHHLGRLTPPRAPLLVVLSGPRGSGKTTSAGRLVDELRQRGLRVAGLLAPGSLRNGVRHDFELVDLARGTRTPFATRDRPAGWLDQGGFRISPAGLAAGRRALDEADAADVVVLDEVGPWELAGHGWAPQLGRLVAAPRPLVLVVRESLVEAVTARWADGRRLLLANPVEPSPAALADELHAAVRAVPDLGASPAPGT